MDHYNDEHANDANQLGSFITGLLIGGLVGAAAMLLLAPQAGKKTRTQIQQKSVKLREQTTQAVEDALAQTRAKTRQLTADVRDKADELEQRGQEVVDEQRDHLGKTLKGLGKTVHT